MLIFLVFFPLCMYASVWRGQGEVELKKLAVDAVSADGRNDDLSTASCIGGFTAGSTDSRCAKEYVGDASTKA